MRSSAGSPLAQKPQKLSPWALLCPAGQPAAACGLQGSLWIRASLGAAYPNGANLRNLIAQMPPSSLLAACRDLGARWMPADVNALFIGMAQFQSRSLVPARSLSPYVLPFCCPHTHLTFCSFFPVFPLSVGSTEVILQSLLRHHCLLTGAGSACIHLSYFARRGPWAPYLCSRTVCDIAWSDKWCGSVRQCQPCCLLWGTGRRSRQLHPKEHHLFLLRDCSCGSTGTQDLQGAHNGPVPTPTP